MRLIYHPDAEAELIEAAQFYERVVPGLGSRFLEAIDAAAKAIGEAPERWRIVEADVRRYLVPQFPYAIYYRSLPEVIRVLAVKHHSRHPEYWRYRASQASSSRSRTYATRGEKPVAMHATPTSSQLQLNGII